LNKERPGNLSMKTSNKLFHPVFIGVFFISMAILSLEVILTRVFSFSIWYHFAYLTISIALLGFGSSGAVLAAYPKILDKGGKKILVIVSVLSCVLIIAAFLIISRHPVELTDHIEMRLVVSLALHFVGVSLPFFFAGIAIAVSLAMFSEDVSYLYFWDLFGAAIGSLLSLLLLNWIGAPGGVMVCAFILLVASCFFASQVSKLLTTVLALLAFVFLGIIPFAKDHITIIPCNTKALSRVYHEPDTYKTLFSKWNAINRVDVYANVKERIVPYWAYLALSSSYKGGFPPLLDMQYDGGNGSNIYQFRGDLDELLFLDYLLFKSPYLLLERPKVLIIGVGGGIDVFNALKNKASSITAVELQPIAVDLLKGRFSQWVGDIYNTYKHINLIACEGRNFISRDHDKYDLIQITATDTFAALNTGAYVLMESYLYTEEACSTFFDHLTETGVLCIIVGDMINDPKDRYQPLNSRLILQYLNVLEAKGIKSPKHHIAILGKSHSHINVLCAPLLKKTPFTEEDMSKLRLFAQEMGFYFIYDPLGENARDNIMKKIIPAAAEERERIICEVPYNITPCTDNNPFFFNFLKWKSVFDVLTPKKFAFATPLFGQLVLLILFILSVFFSFFFIILPLLLSNTTQFRWRNSLGYLFYFFSLGIGFMFMEISFIQKFVLFLGYPAYAFAITLFSLLLFSGVGSYWTSKLKSGPEVILKRIIIILVPVLFSYAWLIDPLFSQFIGQTFLVRVFITVLIQMPLGFILGMFFPIGIKLVNEVDTRMVPWAWGANAMSSVVSSITAIIIAMSFGFRLVTYLAIIVYVLGTMSMFIARASAER
jgi:hypothetical protein